MNKDKLIEYASAIKTYCEDKDGCGGCPFLMKSIFGDKTVYGGCKLDGESPADWDELEVTK